MGQEFKYSFVEQSASDSHQDIIQMLVGFGVEVLSELDWGMTHFQVPR